MYAILSPHYDDEALFLWSKLYGAAGFGWLADPGYSRRVETATLLAKYGSPNHFEFHGKLYEPTPLEGAVAKPLDSRDLDRVLNEFLQACSARGVGKVLVPGIPPWGYDHPHHHQLLAEMAVKTTPLESCSVRVLDAGFKSWAWLQGYKSEAPYLQEGAVVQRVLCSGTDFYEGFRI